MTSNNEYEIEQHQLIKRLLSKVLAMNNRQQQESEINKIAETILKSRPLCSRFCGTPLTGVYQEMYNQAKEELVDHLQKQIIFHELQQDYEERLNSKQLQPAYLYELQTQIFQKILTDDQLRRLGLSAKNYLINSELRAYALTELIKAIKLSGKLCRPHKNKFSPSLYQNLYEEAVAETLSYICLNIDLYDPNRGNKRFMNWVNFKLDKTLLRCYERHHRFAQYELPSFSDLEEIKQPAIAPDLLQIIKDFLTEDPEEMFSSIQIRNRPDANFKVIALAKFSGQTWEAISQQLDIPIPTLSSFYNRWCRRFAPVLETEFKKHFE